MDAFRLETVAEIAGPPDDDALPYIEYLDRLAPLERALRGNGQWSFPHPWLMTFVGTRTSRRWSARSLPGSARPISGRAGSRAFRVPPAVGHDTAAAVAPDELCYAFNLVRIPATDDPRRWTGCCRRRAVYERVRAAGGVVYPVSALSMTGDDWRTHYRVGL